MTKPVFTPAAKATDAKQAGKVLQPIASPAKDAGKNVGTTLGIFDEKAITNIFKKSDKDGDLYLTSQELYDHYVDNAKKGNFKVEVDKVLKQQELIKKYAGDDGKLNIDEFQSLSKDHDYAELAANWGDTTFKIKH